MSDDSKKASLFDLRDAHYYGGALCAATGAALWIHVGAGLLLLGASLAWVAVRRST